MTYNWIVTLRFCIHFLVPIFFQRRLEGVELQFFAALELQSNADSRNIPLGSNAILIPTETHSI
jgi:hypothetical protein